MGMAVADPLPSPLLSLLSNDLILDQTIPYLPVSSVLALSATCKAFQNLILHTPGVFRYLDLSRMRTAAVTFDPIDSGGEIWRNERMDEAVTEDDFYSGPLRGIFSKLARMNVLKDVHTLILDGLSVPADLVAEIMMDDRFDIRILSIREAKNLNERKLMKALQYVCRPTAPRPPRLKGLYVFGSKDSPLPRLAQCNDPPKGVMDSQGAQLSSIGSSWNNKSQRALSQALAPDWYYSPGKVLKKTPSLEWAETVRACQDKIAFDAALCRGIRHDINAFSSDSLDGHPSLNLSAFLPPALATISLNPTGCEICHSSTEGPAVWGETPKESFPLLAPPPLHSSTVAAARSPPHVNGKPIPLFMSCEACLLDRRCEFCNKFWCSNCYPSKTSSQSDTLTHLQQTELTQSLLNSENDYGNEDGLDEGSGRGERSAGGRGIKIMGVQRDCFECGNTCHDCISTTQRCCQSCRGGYCLRHNEGSSPSKCDWCMISRRRTRDLY